MSSSPPESAAALKARALRLLARREHSRDELARKLSPHAESPEALAVLLHDLQAKRQLSDARFAEVRSHWLSRKYGAARIVHDLRSKGVAEDIAARAVSEFNEVEKAKAILARKYRQPVTNREEHARRARFLQSRGFSYDTIRSALSSSPNFSAE